MDIIDNNKKWPIHPYPYTGESLISWVARIAETYQVSLKEFCMRALDLSDHFFDEIDLFAPQEVLEKLSTGTGVPITHIKTLIPQQYEGRLFNTEYDKYTIEMLKTVKAIYYLPLAALENNTSQVIIHRTFLPWTLSKYGTASFCPKCFTEDNRPYYRSKWQIPLIVLCSRHQILLQDKCWRCHVETIKTSLIGIAATVCIRCGANLQLAPVTFANDDLILITKLIAHALENETIAIPSYGVFKSHLFFFIIRLAIEVGRNLDFETNNKVVSQLWRITNIVLSEKVQAKLTQFWFECMPLEIRILIINQAAKALNKWPLTFYKETLETMEKKHQKSIKELIIKLNIFGINLV